MPYVPPPGAGVADGFNNVAAGTQTANSTGTVVFSNANNVTFGMNNNSVVTASASLAGGAGDGYNILGINGVATSGSTTQYLSNANNVSFGLNAGTITASASYPSQSAQPVAMSGSNGSFLFSTATMGNLNGMSFYTSNGSMVGSYTVPTVPAQTEYVLSNSNGVSFGTNGSTVTATVRTDYQSAGAYLTTAQPVGAYLTTARASNDAIGLVTAGTNVTLTANSAGFSFNGGAYLTTAQPVGAYLTTARASNDAIGLNTAITGNGVSMTANSSGLSLNIPAFLTTAMQSASSSVFAKTGFTSASTAGTDMVATLNTNGLSVGVPKWLTTAQPTGAYLTTARASNDAVGLNSAGTNVTWTVNSSGISLNASAYLTTAMASNRGSDFVNATAAFAGTNASGTIASNGISVSVAAPGAGGGIGIAAGTRTATTAGTLLFDNANGITFGLNGAGSSIMTASHNAITTAAQSDHSHGNPTLALTNLTGTTASASNGFTLSLSGNAPGGGAGYTALSTVIGAENAWAQSSSSLAQNSLYIQPHNLQVALSAIAVKLPVMITNSSLASSSGQIGHTVEFAIYTTNATNSTVLARHYSTSYTAALKNSSNVGRTVSLISAINNSTSYGTFGSNSAGLNLSSIVHGPRQFLMPISSLLTAGQYWFAFRQSTSLAGTSNSVFAVSNIIYSSQTNAAWGATTATSLGGIAKDIGLGTYSATTGAIPANISLTQINKAATQPVMYIVNATA